MDEEETGLPKSTVVKTAGEHLPPGFKIAPEARDILLQCCNEFVQMLGSESHTQSVDAKSGTIRPEHVVEALKALEMEEFIGRCKEVADESTAAVKEKAKRAKAGRLESKAKGMNMTMEELKALQQKMMREAAERMAAGGGGGGPAAAPGP
mmetsp:Transcript_8247/g.21058  ORF Transcript_8247/g.21058 Transcript_8247/m.21058 type:complete len:151 (+) Transcript_8247:15-467(+)